jgi:hypothetical protein
MAPKRNSSDAGSASKIKRNSGVLYISGKVKILDMMEIEKKLWADIAKLYGKNEFSIRELMKNKENISLLYRLLRIMLKRQNPLLSYVRERERESERVHCKCTMYCTVHFIITLFIVGNVLLHVIYQLNFTVFMYVTRISQYI